MLKLNRILQKETIEISSLWSNCIWKIKAINQENSVKYRKLNCTISVCVCYYYRGSVTYGGRSRKTDNTPNCAISLIFFLMYELIRLILFFLKLTWNIRQLKRECDWMYKRRLNARYLLEQVVSMWKWSWVIKQRWNEIENRWSN